MITTICLYLSSLRHRNKIALSSGTVVTVVTITVSYLMTRPDTRYLQRITGIETDWKCNRCKDAWEKADMARDDCGKDLQEVCFARGWNFYPVSAVCLNNTQIVRSLEKIVKNSVREEIRHLAESEEPALFRRSVDAFQSSPRFIIHWFLRGNTPRRSQGDFKAWTTARDFERHRSTYTVSSGLEDSYKDGSLVIPENGLYMIHGKLTFSCLKVSRSDKRVGLRILVEETPFYPPFHLLQTLEKERCFQEGDLTTVYQQGMFRLAKGNKIILQYKLARNVELSSGTNNPYKSYIGVTRIGLA